MSLSSSPKKKSEEVSPVDGRYPESLGVALQENPLENILDSNIFSAYIPEELDVPEIIDPRKTQTSGFFRTISKFSIGFLK